jgi:hypothetical protein
MTDQFDLFLRLGLALAIGFLVGFERGWKERSEEEGQRTAGLRTFSLIGLMGGVFGLLSKGGDLLLLAAGFVVLGASLAVFMWREGERENDLSATSLIAAMLTFVLGAFAVLGDMAVAAGAGVAAVVLACRQEAPPWLGRPADLGRAQGRAHPRGHDVHSPSAAPQPHNRSARHTQSL